MQSCPFRLTEIGESENEYTALKHGLTQSMCTRRSANPPERPAKVQQWIMSPWWSGCEEKQSDLPSANSRATSAAALYR